MPEHYSTVDAAVEAWESEEQWDCAFYGAAREAIAGLTPRAFTLLYEAAQRQKICLEDVAIQCLREGGCLRCDADGQAYGHA